MRIEKFGTQYSFKYKPDCGMILNTEFVGKDRQPWLGYGHLQDCLPGQKLSSGPYQPKAF